MSTVMVAAPGHAGLATTLLHLPAELRRRQPHLAAATWLSLLAILPCLLAMALDTRTVNDINIWIKPTKFLASFGVYFATLAWVFGILPESAQATRAGRFVVWAAMLAGLYEILWLLLAAASGVPAHFNFASPFWTLAYAIAGVGSVVLLSAILVQGMMVARTRAASIAPALRTSLVLGAVVSFGATLISAGFLSAGAGHWVGGSASDAAGLALMGWSRTGGDLRVAHFWALHAQQAIPLIGLALVASGRPGARGAVWAFTLAYVGLIACTFAQALRGQPFLAFIG